MKFVKRRNSMNAVTLYLKILTWEVLFTAIKEEKNLLKSKGFIYLTLKHKIEFVSIEDSSVHTQNIECRWKLSKEFLPSVTTFDLIKKYVNKFVHEKIFNLKSAEEKFYFHANMNKPFIKKIF